MPSTITAVASLPASIRVSCVAFSVASLGCSVATDATDASNNQSTSTHALIQVHRQDTVGEAPRADALASFLRVPTTADPSDVLTLAGLRDRLPPVGQCQLGTPSDDPSVMELGDVELVDAEWVRLETPIGVHDLAPHAFPTVTDWIRGVVYASRDQDASNLPAGEEYTFAASSVEGLGDLEVLHQSPPPLEDVRVQGLPVEELTHQGGTVDESGEVRIDWAPSGNPLDTVVIRASFGRTAWSCSYSDTRGEGAVALVEDDGSPLPVGSEATLSVHRIRAVATSDAEDTSLVEVRFDFSVATELTRR